MNSERQLVKVLKKILTQTTPQNYRSFRSTNLKYVTDPLSALGSSLAGGRFNPKGFEALYTSLEIETMIALLLCLTPKTYCQQFRFYPK